MSPTAPAAVGCVVVAASRLAALATAPAAPTREAP